jgi:hypothetical protein
MTRMHGITEGVCLLDTGEYLRQETSVHHRVDRAGQRLSQRAHDAFHCATAPTRAPDDGATRRGLLGHGRPRRGMYAALPGHGRPFSRRPLATTPSAGRQAPRTGGVVTMPTEHPARENRTPYIHRSAMASLASGQSGIAGRGLIPRDIEPGIVHHQPSGQRHADQDRCDASHLRSATRTADLNMHQLLELLAVRLVDRLTSVILNGVLTPGCTGFSGPTSAAHRSPTRNNTHTIERATGREVSARFTRAMPNDHAHTTLRRPLLLPRATHGPAARSQMVGSSLVRTIGWLFASCSLRSRFERPDTECNATTCHMRCSV